MLTMFDTFTLRIIENNPCILLYRSDYIFSNKYCLAYSL